MEWKTTTKGRKIGNEVDDTNTIHDVHENIACIW